MVFGDIIKNARQGRFSQQNLGEQTGVWGTYIGQIEKGDRVPSDELCLQLARVLELDPRMLLLAAYRKRAQAKETRELFEQIETLLSDPVISRILGNRRVLNASILEALEQPSIRRALRDTRWREAITQSIKMTDRDIPELIQIVKRMTPQQWEALLTTAKAMSGIS